MNAYRATADINAPIEVVWETLVDLEAYPSWNPFTIAVASNLAVGQPVNLHVVMWRGWLKLWQEEVLQDIKAPDRLCWGVSMLGGAIVGARTQELEPLPGGGTRYTTVDTISGPLSWLVHLLFGTSLNVGFSGVAEGLKKAAESRVQPGPMISQSSQAVGPSE